VRVFSPATGKKRTIGGGDLQDTVLRVKVFLWSGAGLLLAFLLGVRGMVEGAWGWGMVVWISLLGWAVSFFGPLLLASLAGRGIGQIHNPSGASTPRRREYSQAESLAVREDHLGAITAFELAIAEDGSDPWPYLRIARIYRDGLGRHDDAAHWFKRALADSGPPVGMATLIRRELIELCEVKMGSPERAAPILARMAEELAGSADGEWAAGELARVKELVRGRARNG
jgi:hypothetical protein